MSEGSLVALTEENFTAEVNNSPVPVLADFWAPWCMPCRIIAPILEELAAEMKGTAKFAKANIDEEPALAQKFGIHSIPTLIIFRDGKEADRIIGAVSKESLKKALDTG